MSGQILNERPTGFSIDVVVVGGCGHVGLPLAIAFADRGLSVVAYDINPDSVAQVNSAVLPFDEPGAAPVLEGVIASGRLVASTDPLVIESAEHIVVVIGTPVDEHLNPDARAVPDAVAALHPHLRVGQIVVLRSTVFPGVTALVEEGLAAAGLGDVGVAFCPERIAEGHAMTELFSLPQIISARSTEVADRADHLFRRLTEQTVHVTPEEAELAKLFTNTWRYIKFAASNQLFMMANDFGVDFERVRHAITFQYPRAIDMPGAGFAAGPCLFKDTMQLAAFNDNKFALGHSAMLINEGLPLYVVSRAAQRFELKKMTVGILGMAFKAESDDSRSSLSYKLKRILRFRAANVLTADPYVRTDPSLVSEEELLERSDLVIIGAPHRRYRDLVTDVPLIDIWNMTGNGVVI